MMKYLILICLLVTTAAQAQRTNRIKHDYGSSTKNTDLVCCESNNFGTNIYDKIQADRCDKWVGEAMCTSNPNQYVCCEYDVNNSVRGLSRFTQPRCTEAGGTKVEMSRCWAPARAENMKQGSPKHTIGKSDGNCGDCVLKQNLIDGQWNRWNGYEVFTKAGKYVAHTLNSAKCEESEKFKKSCNMKEEPATTEKTDLKEVVITGHKIDYTKCTWGAQRIIQNNSKVCKDPADICVGQMVCGENKDKVFNLACNVDSNGACPSSVEACDKDHDYQFSQEHRKEAPATNQTSKQ